jgi:OHCU decarboxylase
MPGIHGVVNIAHWNALPTDEFVEGLRGIWEHSPWIAREVATARPFASREDLLRAMWEVVLTAPDDRKLALLRAHPDLAGKFARAAALTAESAGEQASAGLDRLSDAEYERFTDLNAAYCQRFGFPFIVCVRNHTKESILHAFGRRLANSQDIELQNALDEVRRIAEYRLNDLIEP